MNYAIFRSEPIFTTSDLAQIGAHNKREKKAYKSNPDIKLELSKNNIDLVPLTDKYVKGFYNLTSEYKKQHEEKMKTEREDRKRTYKQMVDKSKNIVADELLFTATSTFFDDMTREDILKWANTCMDFVYNDLGYKKEQVLHSVIHLDEKTPHIHCVVVPLIKKYDKRTKTERYTISKKQYIKDKNHLSLLQDKYHERLVNNGFDLERGIKGSDAKHIKIKDYKKMADKINRELNTKNDKLDRSLQKLDENMKSNKGVLFDKDYVKIKKETFDNMNKVIKETKKVLELQPKLQNTFNEIDTYTKSYQTLEKENKNIQKEVKYLKTRNNNLQEENKSLKAFIKAILSRIKDFFRKLLLHGNEKIKEDTTTEIKEFYDIDNFDTYDVIDIAKDTTKEDELFDYVGYEKDSNYDYDYYKNDDDDFDMTL